jgi:tRNA-specific 2-thiouridylase
MRVVVAMSGGVDSSAAAALLKEQGHEVLGITLRVWSYESKAQCGSCCSPEDIDDARAVADALGISFYVADVEELFKDRVVHPFVKQYLGGRTPIPCVSCNQDVKFGFLLQRARALGAKLATGHYARVHRHDHGGLELHRAVDAAKDQSYFLFTLGQTELNDVIFPVGGLSKSEVRAVAERHRLPTTHKPESMEICFVPGGNYARFVEKIAGPQPKGDVVDASGRVLGSHDGVHKFTIGQRKGLGLAVGAPLYVQRVDADSRRVVVGPAEQLGSSEFHLLKPHWVDGVPPTDRALTVKVRHRHEGATARVQVDGAGHLAVKLETPVRAVTPGQAAVFYEGERVLGGGWIA